MGCNGCCMYEVSGARNFFTKSEKIQMLKDYQKQLESEAKGVAERVKQMEDDE